jgi:chorismate dehydratase
MTAIRIGTVEYLNTAPLLRGLDAAAGVSCIRAVPSRIIDLLVDDRVDIGLVSLIDVARSPVPLAVLPVGMIGCDGPTLTVRLFSDRPIDRIERVAADTDSHTSVTLAKVLLRALHGIEPDFVDYDARERVSPPVGGDAGSPADDAWPPALLLIGDKVVADTPPAVRYPHQLDLGEAWQALTGLPFVYAVWACHADRLGTDTIRHGAELLDRTRRRNRHRPDQIVNETAADHGWPADLARGYLGRLLRYRFGPRELEAAQRFLAMAGDAGLSPQTDLVVGEFADFVPTPG